MRNRTIEQPNLHKYFIKAILGMFVVPVLSVWLVGSAVCAVIALIGGVLGALGVNGIGLSISPGYYLPGLLSLPAGILLALLLGASCYYTRRFLRGSLRYIKS